MSVGHLLRDRLSEPIDLGHPRPYISVRQMADYLTRSDEWVRRRIRSGEIRVSRWVGCNEIRIAWADFLAFLQAGYDATENTDRRAS